MEYIPRSASAMALIVAALFFYAVSIVLAVVFYATLTPDLSLGLYRASAWLGFVAGIAAFSAVATAAWETVPRKDWIAFAETAVASAATMLYAIGLLIEASTVENGTTAGGVVKAIGLGVWGLVALSRSARLSLAEQKPETVIAPITKHQPAKWLVAAGGLLATAVGAGLIDASTGTSDFISAGAVTAAGMGAICGALIAARRQGFLRSAVTSAAVTGLAVLAAGILTFAIALGTAAGSHWSPTIFRAATATTTAIQLIGVLILGGVAWHQVRILYRSHALARIGTVESA